MADQLPLQRSVPIKCDSCSCEMQSPAVCSQCHTLHPVDDVNYFDLLGLEATYDIDSADVQRRYLNLARAVHPDRLPSGTPEVEQLSLRTTAQINQAKTVLSDPVQRAAYLLELAGGDGGMCNDAAACKDAVQCGKAVSPTVLMETMEFRETIEEAKAAGDTQALVECKANVEARYNETLETIAQHARILPGDENTQAKLRESLNTISYYKKILQQF